MKVLVGCEYSGIVSTAFRLQGHEAYSCDLEPGFNPGWHLQMDVFEAVDKVRPDLAIFHPPCTYLCRGSQYLKDKPGRNDEMIKAVEFVRRLASLDIEHIAIENPVGLLSVHFRKYDQLLYPWEYGDPYAKDICFWLKNLPPLTPLHTRPPEKLKRVSNHTNSRMTQAEKSKIKSKFFPSLAAQMALQWGSVLSPRRHLVVPRSWDDQVTGRRLPGDNRSTNLGRAADVLGTLNREDLRAAREMINNLLELPPTHRQGSSGHQQ